MNRQQRRVIHKLTGQELYKKEMEAMGKGINGTLAIVRKVMNEEFGFGAKRLDRLDDAVLKKLGEM